jgi:hypothetical protein
MAKRAYSDKTLKVLFASCGNQCAFPGCTHPVIAQGSEVSQEAVLGEICHIFAASDNGPRGKPDLSESERNSPENLIILCGFHHLLVDAQHQDFPAELLKRWKREHERTYQDSAEAIRRQGNAQQNAFVTARSDQQIEEQLRHIRNGRFLQDYPTPQNACNLALSVTNSELTGGSSAVRARALAWCARLLVRVDGAAKARDLLARSRELGNTDEADIAEAFIVSAEAGNSVLALEMLAPMDTQQSRSAMLRLVSADRGDAAALEWVHNAGLDFHSFDSEGKLNLIMSEQAAGRWDDAYVHVQALTSADFDAVPALNHAAAQAYLAQALPEELRGQAPFQVPFEGQRVSLSDHRRALDDRRRAIEFYERLVEIGGEYGIVKVATLGADMALWLRLRDPELLRDALSALRDSLRDDAVLLRRLPLALEFGVKVDLAAVERRVNQRVALTGKGTFEEALARLALALTREDPAAAVEYFNAHRAQLSEFLERSALIGIEIELLCRSGQGETARAVLAGAEQAALAQHDLDRLCRMIAEAEGADPAAERRRLYEQTGSLRDLSNLVSFLEQHEAWNDLAPLAETLFNRTHMVEDAVRVAKALTRSGKRRDALRFLQGIQDIVARDNELQSLYAWALYQDGQLRVASHVLEPLRKKRDAVNDCELFVNLAMASGQWDRLVAYTTREWERRAQRSAERLMRAGQLAQAVHAPYARELIVAATEAAPDDPAILASAYFHATQAGWEDVPAVGNWLHRAANNSGNQGPLQPVTMEELLKLKPDWERRRDASYAALRAGSITIAGAVHGMNQSMSGVCLRAAANRMEPDARRRTSIFAFSGARPAVVKLAPRRVALDLTAIFTFAQMGILPAVLAHFEQVLIPVQLLVWLFQERLRVAFHQPSQVRDAQFVKRLVEQGVLRVLGAATPTDLAFAQDIGFDLAAMLDAAAGSQGDAYVIRPSPVHRLGSVIDEEVDITRYEGCLCSCQALVDAMRMSARITASEAQQAHSYLRLREQRWPKEPQIKRGSILYLDDLAMTYLRAAGVLDRLKGAGYTVYITKSLDDHGRQLLEYENLASTQLEEIEKIRAALASAIDDGSVEMIPSDEHDRGDTLLQAQLNFLGTDKVIDAFVVDDRFVNRFLHMTRRDGQTPILTSLDVVEHMIEAGVISVHDGQEYRTNLRRFGYTFVPVLEDELIRHLLEAPIDDGILIETAELRAIREAAQLLRFREVLQAPHELAWLNHFKLALLQAVRTIWETEAAPAIAEARCEWILGQLDTRGWASIVVPESVTTFVVESHAAMLHALCYAPESTLRRTSHAYHRWIDRRLLSVIKETEPEVFEQLVVMAAGLLDEILNHDDRDDSE